MLPIFEIEKNGYNLRIRQKTNGRECWSKFLSDDSEHGPRKTQALYTAFRWSFHLYFILFTDNGVESDLLVKPKIGN